MRFDFNSIFNSVKNSLLIVSMLEFVINVFKKINHTTKDKGE